MPSPSEDTNAVCQQCIGGEAVMEFDVATTDIAQNLSDVDISTIAVAIPEVTLTQVAINEDTSWLRRPAPGVAPGALKNVDGVWTRTVQVLTAIKAHVDSICPIANTAYIYYDDDEAYDSTLTEKSTGFTYVTQLIYDSETNVYYVYKRWGEADYTFDGPYETIESAKKAFQVTYKEKFDVEWAERETTSSEKWAYEVMTFEPYEELTEIEEIVEETKAELIIAREKATVVDDTVITEATTVSTIKEDVALEHVAKEIVVVETEEQEEAVRDVRIVKGTGVVMPAASSKLSWFRRVVTGGDAAVVDGESECIDEEDDDPFVLGKTRSLVGGKKGGSAGLSTTATAAVASASLM